MAARIAWLSARLVIRPALSLGSYLPSAPWPWGVVDFAARAIAPAPGTVRTGIGLTHCTAQLIRAAGVLPADGTRRAVLYMHGGAFLTCGAYSHGRLVSMLSSFADSPVLVPNYRKIPKDSISEAIDDCYDGYRWLRRKGFEPDQIVLAGDSAGGYLALALAQRLLECGERPAALVAMSPLLQLAAQHKTTHPNVGSDAMFPPRAFDALHGLIASAAAHRGEANGYSDALYEPLDHIRPGLPPHVDPCVRLRGAASRRAAGGSTTGRRRCAGRTAGMAGPNPRIPTRRADDSRSHPLTASDRPLYPRSDQISREPWMPLRSPG
jgi:epsilon-lactone hydrolase